MQHLRKAAIAATSMSILTITITVFCHNLGWPTQTDRFQTVVLTLIGVGAGTCGVAFWCTHTTIQTLAASTAELLDRVTQETKMLHRSMATVMEQYGDARAVDAVLANERRHVVNERATEETVDLTNRNVANVTQLHKRQ